MTGSIAVAGGVYAEHCLWPDWDQVFGSGGRAACALTGNVGSVVLHAWASPQNASRMQAQAKLYGVATNIGQTEQSIGFDYVHAMAVPTIRPSPGRIRRLPPLEVDAEVVLRFGMLESSARVRARRAIYDPQSTFGVDPFEANGSSADGLAIVGNRREIAELGGLSDPVSAARALVDGGRAAAVVVKAGVVGAYVVEKNREPVLIPPFQSASVWTIGSGDVFAAAFALLWAFKGAEPREAAMTASKAVADYAVTRALPMRSPAAIDALDLVPCLFHAQTVYLAGPFFTIAQRWLIDETKRCLEALGLEVFSPVHDVGRGPAETVAVEDLRGLDRCGVVFAIVDGLDSGTLFEIGYARAKDIPVYAFAQIASDEDMKMLDGSGCRIERDLVTALHRLAWRT